MFRRLDKFDGHIFGEEGDVYTGGGGVIFGMLIGLHIWGAYIRGGGLYTGDVFCLIYIFPHIDPSFVVSLMVSTAYIFIYACPAVRQSQLLLCLFLYLF